ncbi:DUF6343 family protein [Modestobacter sp. VKM Ac-2984]|uniref:DUF6343 family protein n=1 Tax=Modestobacter sp. VKM Ac-2984 TaxID=3004138 RepID=UPI0022AAEDAC|nr:DUF6343 family protein [Modestobacter sp. VKM Ac-2984]MCZ2818441.1 DUF6343 family protein [Modestobacter sp. VKM Ac-2984]
MSTSPPDDRRTPDDLTEYERDHFPHGIPESQPRYQEGGAGNARSALTLRLALATFGLVVCAVLAVLAFLADVPLVLPIAVTVLAVIALVDLVVVARRKLRGEPG